MLKYNETAPLKSYPFPFCEEDSFLFIFSSSYLPPCCFFRAPNVLYCALASDIFTLTKSRVWLRIHLPPSLGTCPRLAFKSSSIVLPEREARAVDCLCGFFYVFCCKSEREIALEPTTGTGNDKRMTLRKSIGAWTVIALKGVVFPSWVPLCGCEHNYL